MLKMSPSPPTTTCVSAGFARYPPMAIGTARLFGLYSRKVWWLTHITALYLIEGAAIDFRPNLEVRAVCWAEPSAPPPDTAAATARRLAELASNASPAPHW